MAPNVEMSCAPLNVISQKERSSLLLCIQHILGTAGNSLAFYLCNKSTVQIAITYAAGKVNHLSTAPEYNYLKMHMGVIFGFDLTRVRSI